MAKGSSSLRNNKARSSKPYDASNSFVKKVTSQVTNFLPQSEWFPFKRWFRTSQQSIESDDDDDDGVVDNPQPPPSKRAKISLNRTFPVNSFRVADEAQLRERRPQFESPSPVRHAYPDAVAGPSGLSTSARYSASSNLQSTMVTENLENKLNGDGGSDSSESTSGCSSLVPQASKQNQSETLAARRRTIDEKLNLTNHLQSPRSLFPNRVRTPRIAPPPSRRRPSFNASVFSSPLLESDRLPSKDLSPFYAGRTMYGGASAYRRPRESSFVNELNVSKRGIQVRPINDSKNSPEASMSHTARRILEALEQFSTPVQDAKRMPLNCPLYRPPLGSKRKCVESEARPPPPPPLPSLLPRVGPPTQSLTVPTVADLIKLRCKEKLQDSMESARRIASSSAEPYSLRLGEERKGARHPGKMMKSSRIEYEANDVNLPEVSLPITTMPKFDIIVPPVSTAASSVESSFKFSSPITVTSALPNVTSQGTFTFSAPLNKGIGQAVVTQNFLPSCPSLLESVDSFKNKPKIVGKGLVPKSKGQSNSVGIDIKPASELKTGSVMDFFAQQKKEESGKDKNSVSASVGFGEAFKPASGTWECDACMIRNKADATVCLACEAPRQAKAALLVKPSSAWTCTSCFVPNKDSDAACVCCTNPKPGTVPAKKSGAEPAGSSWNCEACGAVNSCASNSCSECWCNKPNNSSEPPKTSSQSVVAENKSTWTCSYCMTCNENENVSCKSCKKTKVGSKTSSSKIKFNFEIPAEASTFKFGVDNSGNPPTTVNNLGGFKFGETAVTASSVNFTFGVPSSSVVQSSDKQKDVTVTSASSSFAAVLAKGSQDGNTSKVGGFNFGTNQNQSSEVSNSSSRTSKRGSDSIDDANVKVPGTGSGAGPKRKADVPESVVNGVKSAQKRKAESAESVVNEVKSEQNEKPSSGLSKPFVINTNTNVSKPTTIPSIFSTAVSSSSLGAGTPAKTKTASSGGFSFVSSSTSGDKSTTTTTSMPTSAPSFVFGSGASKTTESSVTKKPVSINSAPVTTATVVPSFGSCVTSSAGFGSNANTVSSGNATTSSTTTFGTISPKPVFGTAATTTTTTTTPSFSTPAPTAKMSFTPPTTTTPSFGVPDTTTPAFGTSATKPNSVTTTSATLTFGGSTVPSAAPLFGVAPAATAPNFGVSPATSSPSISSSSATAASFGTTASTALTFNATPVTTASPFGSTPATTATGFGSSSTATPIFGSSAAATVPSFGATPATTASGFGVTPATTVPAFGSASATVTPAFGTTSGTSSPFSATPTPSFGVTTTSTAPSFGSASTTSTPTFGTATSSFGSAAKPGSFGSASPVPSFGIPSTKTPAFGTTPVTHSFGTPTATPSFGNSTVNAVNFNTTGTSAFGTPITTSTVGFGTPTITPSFGTSKTETNFAAPATTAPAFGTPTTSPSFGSGFGSTSTPFGGFSAGAAKGGASSSPGTFVFKGNATPSIFGGSQTTSNNAECPPSKIPNFGFGTANTGSSNASAAAPSFGAFNFSAGSGAAPSVFGASAGGANATSGSVFGTGTTPAFGTSGGSSGFGSGGFNFTAGSSTGSQPFTFNNPQSNQNNTPAFGQVQQSQPQPQPAPPTFNPNVRPTFDFTRGETPQFTAQSSAPLVTTSRRIKKAVRRTVR